MPFDLGHWLCFWPFARGRARPWAHAGDASRDAGDWAQAAAHYRRAVAIEPGRRAILVQLGHAEKETGALAQALAAYRRASALPGTDGDAPFHWGQLAGASGDMTAARQALDQALREDPGHRDARRERLALAHVPGAGRMAATARAAEICRAERERAATDAPSPATLFDASDLLTYFRHARLPTGIQRVQIEVIASTLALDPHTQICAFLEEQGRWATLPAPLFQTLAALSVAGGDTLDAAWLETIEVLTAVLASGLQPRFDPGAWLVNLGTSCQYHNYFLHIRDLQRRHGLRYVPFVHDLIPIMAPQFCVEGLTQDFLGWSAGVFDHAFAFLTNSRATRADLQQVSAQYGHTLADEQIAVIRLDARQEAVPESGDLARWGLAAGGYVLFVSTIEARKNHLLALRGWAQMIARYGAQAVPDLICVGQNGWLNDAVYRLLAQDAGLAAKVSILSGLSDGEIALLYRHCRFTLYPSHYEGWGLPVTESLCHGKVPVISRRSSLPEAGGDLALYIDPDDSEGLVALVERLWADTPWREGLEARIATQFHPRSWRDLAAQIGGALQDFARMLPEAQAPPVPVARPGMLYRLTRQRLMRPVRHADDGERWRIGTGWDVPGDDGCRSLTEGGALLAHVSGEAGPLWCCLRLRGRAIGLAVNGRDHRVTPRADAPQWVAIAVEPGPLHITISGGVVLSGMMVVARQPNDTADLARAIAACGHGPHRLLRDLHDVLRGGEIDARDMLACLPALESGALTVESLIASWAPSPVETVAPA